MNLKSVLISLIVLYLGEIIFAQDNMLPQSGNVGIGTLSPDSRLNVNGNVKIDSTLIVKDSVMIKKNLRVEQDVRFLGLAKMNDVKVLDNFVSNGLSKLNGEVKMTSLQEAANLTNKYVLLTNENGLVKRIHFDSLAKLMGGLNPTGSMPFDFCDIPGPQGQYFSDNPYWRSLPNKLVVPCSGVNVGIGTDAPKTKLDVRGGIYCTRFAMNVDPTTMGTNYFRMKIDNSNPTFANATVLVIENTQRTLLQLNNDGILRTREIYVDAQTPWPDYVFEPNYSLPSLLDVKKFIEKNRHLPNVPTASEIAQQGINLGEMNKVLVEKIEQLTLYLIQQQERIDALENEMKKLK